MSEIKLKKESMHEYRGSNTLCNALLCIHQIFGSDIRSEVRNPSDTTLLPQTKRVVTVLRFPRFLKQEARYLIDKYNSTRESTSHLEESQDNLIRVEELLLISLHPHTDNPISTVPIPSKPSELKWAEPGWYLDLSVPRCSDLSSSIQSSQHHRDSSYEILNKYTSALTSSTGHQLATCVPIHHLKALEPNDESLDSILDPFCPSEDILKESYNFFLPHSTTKSTTIKKANSKKKTNVP